MSRSTRSLLTVLGVTFGLAVTIGNSIGAGILRTPGDIAAQLPTLPFFFSVWIAGGVYALLGSNALAELGTMLPRSGGQYVFVREGLGDYPGFIVGWSDWLSTCGTTAAVAIVIGEYVTVLLPVLRSVKMSALVVIGVLTIVQWFGVRWGGSAQTITSLLKAIALLFLIGVCFYFGGRNAFETSFEPERETSLFVAFIVSLQAVIYTYDGWSAVVYFSEEVREPGKSIPRSIFGGVLSVIAIYLLLNIAFLKVVPLPTIAGQDLAAGVVAEHLFGLSGHLILRALTIVALLSAVNSNVLMAPRVLFAMSRDGLFWRGATEVNAGGTPDVALLISTVITVLFIVTGTFETVIAKLAFFFVANYSLSFLTLFVLRVRRPDAPRPWRAWGHPITTGLALLASLAFLGGAVWADRSNSVSTLILLAVSYPMFLLMRRRIA